MPSADRNVRPIGVGVVGVRPGPEAGLMDELPQGDMFQLVGFSDEGLEGGWPEDRPGAFYSDYNMLLHDPKVELILVDGPVELRRDFAVRALNAGHHAVLRPPFGQAPADGERIMKTALRQGLVATVDMPLRDDPDLLALEEAIRQENVPAIHGALCFQRAPEPLPAEKAPLDLFGAPEDEEDSPEALRPDRRDVVLPGGALARAGAGMLYQLRLLVREDVKSVSAHLERPRQGDPDNGFFLYLPLRGGGWAIVQAGQARAPGVPRWVLYAPHATFTAQDGTVTVVTGGQQRTYTASGTPQSFWQNLHAAVRHGADLKCHPVDVVRAMKMHEAAVASVELGEPVTL